MNEFVFGASPRAPLRRASGLTALRLRLRVACGAPRPHWRAYTSKAKAQLPGAPRRIGSEQ